MDGDECEEIIIIIIQSYIFNLFSITFIPS